MQGVQRFKFFGKLSPRSMGPFKILERIGYLAYQLALLPHLTHVHNMFHVSMLWKYRPNPHHIIDYHSLKVKEDAFYEEFPKRILDWKEKVLRNRTITYVKV